MNTSYSIAVLGLWHLGEVYSACLSELGHQVIGISDEVALIDQLQKNIPPLAEPQLVELLETNKVAGRLFYSTEYTEIRKANVVWLTFDTPVNNQDEVDLTEIFAEVQKIIPHLNQGVTIATSSQLPVGTSKKIREMIRTARPNLQFEYFYTPENLRLGEAIQCFMEPGRIVVGADTVAALETAKNIFSTLHAEIIPMNVASAEMSKHALNAWLATSISFTNDLADVCEQMGADIEDVIKALKTDPRVGQKSYLFAGLGFSGGTLGRDLKALMQTAQTYDLEIPIIAGAYVKNSKRDAIVESRLQKEWGKIAGKTIAMLGVTYKAGTSTLRRSQPLAIEARLRALGATMRLYDPLAIPKEVAQATPSAFFKDPYEAAKGCDLVLVMTPSRDYRELDFKKLGSVMRTPFLFDTGNILAPVEEKIQAAGV
jgi:UDPglucose 6-dehydrogenase